MRPGTLRRCPLLARCQALEDSDNLREGGALVDRLVGPRLQRPGEVVDGAQYRHARFGARRLEVAYHLGPVAVGEHQVHDGKVEGPRIGSEGDGLGDRGGAADLGPLGPSLGQVLPEHEFEGPGEEGVVLDHKYSRRVRYVPLSWRTLG